MVADTPNVKYEHSKSFTVPVSDDQQVSGAQLKQKDKDAKDDLDAQEFNKQAKMWQ